MTGEPVAATPAGSAAMQMVRRNGCSPTVAMLASADDEAVLAWQAAGGWKTDTIPASMRARAAALFRNGLLLGAAPSGDGIMSSALPAGGGAGVLGAAATAQCAHAAHPPRLRACPILSIASDDDKVWPDTLVHRWAEVAPADDAPADDATGAAGAVAWVHETLRGVGHIALMTHPRTMELVFQHVGVAAARHASRRSTSWSPGAS